MPRTHNALYILSIEVTTGGVHCRAMNVEERSDRPISPSSGEASLAETILRLDQIVPSSLIGTSASVHP